MSKQHKIFIPIQKIDEERRLVYGIATAEAPDKQGEICDYETSKPFYEKWSADIEKASDGKSKGNLRVMHGSKVAGTIPQINFNDEDKQIEICAKVIDNDEWKMVLAGAYTGFSQGGSYEKKWKDGDYTRYTSNPCEISLVDNPCLSSATFEVLKSDGTKELRKFQNLEQNKMSKNIDNEAAKSEVVQGWQATDGSFHLVKSAAVAHNEDLEKKAKEAEDEKEPAAKSEKDDEAEKAKKADAEDEKPEDKKDDKKVDPKEDDKEAAKKSDVPVVEEPVEKAAEGDLKKYTGNEIYDVSRAIDALCIVSSIFSSESFAAKFEGENQPQQLADLKLIMEKLKSFIASEIMESEEDENTIMQMADKGELKKAGAKISGANKAHLSKMMKSAKDHMDTMSDCMKSLGAMEDDKESAEKSQKAEADLLEKAELQKKSEDESNAKFQKLGDTINTLLKRIDSLEAQPAEAKGVRLVTKDNHEGENGNSNPVEEINRIVNKSGESPLVLAGELLKMIHKKQ